MNGRFLDASLLFCTLIGPLVPGHIPVGSRAVSPEVTSPADGSPGTLRQALLDVASGDTITFDPATFPSDNPVMIFACSTLPTLSKNNLTIDGSNTGVILDGSQALIGTNGLIIAGSHCIIRGLGTQHFAGNDLYIAVGATDNTIGGDRSMGGGPGQSQSGSSGEFRITLSHACENGFYPGYRQRREPGVYRKWTKNCLH